MLVVSLVGMTVLRPWWVLRTTHLLAFLFLFIILSRGDDCVAPLVGSAHDPIACLLIYPPIYSPLQLTTNTEGMTATSPWWPVLRTTLPGNDLRSTGPRAIVRRSSLALTPTNPGPVKGGVIAG